MSLLIIHHLGLGDHLLCNGLYRELLVRHHRLFFIVKKHNFRSLRQIFSDVSGIYMLPIPGKYADAAQKVLRLFARLLRFPYLGLGFYGVDFLTPGESIRYDENFYRQAKIDFDCRWTSFKVNRDTGREKEVFESLVTRPGPYAFVHQDLSREFRITESHFSPEIEIVEPHEKHRYLFLDYLMVIEQATEIHCIESSFAVLIESLDLPCRKFAHRYARPEASQDSRLEFTYRSDWRVLN